MNDSDRFYRSAYIDLSLYPKFSFGYGLSYTHFTYSDIKLNKQILNANDKLEASVIITNTGNYDGEETVQLYIRDMAGSVVRPVKELKGFRRVMLEPGETQTVALDVTPDCLALWNIDMQRVVEPGEFAVMIGPNSVDLQATTLTVA